MIQAIIPHAPLILLGIFADNHSEFVRIYSIERGFIRE